jgi:hypothetical protein
MVVHATAAVHVTAIWLLGEGCPLYLLPSAHRSIYYSYLRDIDLTHFDGRRLIWDGHRGLVTAAIPPPSLLLPFKRCFDCDRVCLRKCYQSDGAKGWTHTAPNYLIGFTFS